MPSCQPQSPNLNKCGVGVGGGQGIWTKDFSPGIMALNVEKWWKMLPNMAHFSEDKVV